MRLVRNPFARLAAPVRTVAGLFTGLAMLVLAWYAVVVSLFASWPQMDPGDPAPNEALSALALVAAVALLVGTGPVAWVISGRRWLLLFPVVVAVVWAIGIGIAAAT